jgi:chitodextrinase
VVTAAPSDALSAPAGAGVDAQGNGATAWSEFADTGASTEVVRAAGYDGAGPRLSNLAVPASGVAGQQLPFSVAATDVWSTFSVDWAFGDGATASGPALQHAYRHKGQYTVTATGRDALGNTTPLSASTAIAALRVSKASLLHRTFRDGARSTLVVARRRRAPRGTKIRFRLPIAATVRIAVERRAAGRRVGRRCVKATRKNRRRNACARYIRALPILRRAGHAGANTVAFSGRVRGRALRPRRYRFTLTATGAGGARSKAVHLAFRVVR